MKFRDFVKNIFKLTFVLMVILTGLSFFSFSKNYLYFTWVCLFFFLALTLFSGYYNTRSIKKPFFLNIFFGTLAVKFVLSILFILGYLILEEEKNKWFVIPFFTLFFVYKVFETYMLLKFAREGTVTDEK